MANIHEQGPQREGPPKTERKPLIPLQRSVIPACDFGSLSTFEKLVRETGDIEGIGGYKVGIELVARYGAIEVVKRGKEYTDKPIIYDYQKAGNDIPDLGPKFAEAMSEARVDSVILFPFSSPKTQEEWTKACQEAGLHIMIGGHMTQERFLESEGGYIADSAPRRIYELGAEMGVRDFVVPGNKVEFVETYRRLLEDKLGEGNFTLNAPGFIGQGGSITEVGQVAGENWHAIIGGAIYRAENMREAAQQMVSQIV